MHPGEVPAGAVLEVGPHEQVERGGRLPPQPGRARLAQAHHRRHHARAHRATACTHLYFIQEKVYCIDQCIN